MEVGAIREKRKAVESEIKRLLQTFERETEAYIEDVRIGKSTFCSDTGGRETVISEISLKVSI